jgi:hypothetical protein
MSLIETIDHDFVNYDLDVVSSTYAGNFSHKPNLLSARDGTYINEKSNYIELCVKQDFASGNPFVFTLKLEDFKNSTNISGIVMPFVAFTLPAIKAQSYSDKLAYCDLPGLQIFETVDIIINGSPTESLNFLMLNKAIKDMLKTDENYLKHSMLYFGGLKGSNQEFNSYAEPQTDIKGPIKCLVPLPFHLFRNEEIFSNVMSEKSEIKICLNLKNYCNIMNYNKHCAIALASTQLSMLTTVYLSTTSINPKIFNMLPQVDLKNETPYFVRDIQQFRSHLKKSTDIEFSLSNEDAISEYYMSTSFEPMFKNYVFLGSTNESAREMYWASMLKHSYIKEKQPYAIVLKTCLFVNNNDKNSDYSIIQKDEYSFILKYQLGSGLENETVISFSIKLSDFPETFCLDLETMKTVHPEAVFLRPYYFSNVNFIIKPFDKYNEIHLEEPNSSDQNITNLHHGIFSFISNNIKYAFEGVNMLRKSKNLNELLYDISASISVTTVISNADALISNKFIFINRPFWRFYDLSGKHEIKIEEYSMNRKESTKEITKDWQDIILDKQLQNNCNYNCDDFQMHKIYYFQRNHKKTNGFYFSKTVTTISVKLEEVNFIFNNLPFTFQSRFVHFKMPINFVANFIQCYLRYFKYNKGCISYLKNPDLKQMTEHILNDEEGCLVSIFELRDVVNEEECNLESIKVKRKVRENTRIDDTKKLRR